MESTIAPNTSEKAHYLAPRHRETHLCLPLSLLEWKAIENGYDHHFSFTSLFTFGKSKNKLTVASALR